MKAKEIIARRVAQEFKDGDVVNLGFGIPNASADYIPEGVNVILQAENGALRFGETPTKDTYNPNLANSGGAPITLLPGAALFDLQTSFAIIRGGHVDATVLGALEVSQDGSGLFQGSLPQEWVERWTCWLERSVLSVQSSILLPMANLNFCQSVLCHFLPKEFLI